MEATAPLAWRVVVHLWGTLAGTGFSEQEFSATASSSSTAEGRAVNLNPQTAAALRFRNDSSQSDASVSCFQQILSDEGFLVLADAMNGADPTRDQERQGGCDSG